MLHSFESFIYHSFCVSVAVTSCHLFHIFPYVVGCPQRKNCNCWCYFPEVLEVGLCKLLFKVVWIFKKQCDHFPVSHSIYRNHRWAATVISSFSFVSRMHISVRVIVLLYWQKCFIALFIYLLQHVCETCGEMIPRGRTFQDQLLKTETLRTLRRCIYKLINS